MLKKTLTAAITAISLGTSATVFAVPNILPDGPFVFKFSGNEQVDTSGNNNILDQTEFSSFSDVPTGTNEGNWGIFSVT